jgi:hypothetical protein
LQGFRCLNRQHSHPFSALRHPFQTQPDLQIIPIEKIRLPRRADSSRRNPVKTENG